MATIRGGDIEQLLINGREFDSVAEANVTYRLGGWKNESSPTGNGGMHTKRTRKLGGFDSLPLSVDSENKDLEYIQDLIDDGEPVTISMTKADGITYSGDLTIEGDLDANTGDGQVEVSALGPTFEQI
ncbi:MAG: hypothetical protein PQJ46_09425 [Spirochaetales bacterium]|nr:hypothetical protein [Spirochaetales bacterium]